MSIICGPKCATFGVILSIWGIVQLSIMSLFCYVKSVALIEDLPLKPEEDYSNIVNVTERYVAEVMVSFNILCLRL